MPECPKCNIRWIASVTVCPRCKIAISDKGKAMHEKSCNAINTKNSDSKNQPEDYGANVMAVFVVVFLFYLLPVSICFIINFTEQVAFGDANLSQFDWQHWSFGQVNGFYENLMTWFKGLGYKLTH